MNPVMAPEQPAYHYNPSAPVPQNMHPMMAQQPMPMQMQPQPIQQQPQMTMGNQNSNQSVNNNTNVVVQAPGGGGTTVVMYGHKRQWTTQLLACVDDVPACLASCFCPCCYAMYVSYVMREGVCMPVCVPGGMIALRTMLRAENKIKGSIFRDCCVFYWCFWCALCQLRREHEHVAKAKLVKQQVQLAAAAPVMPIHNM